MTPAGKISDGIQVFLLRRIYKCFTFIFKVYTNLFIDTRMYKQYSGPVTLEE